jgi:hypothetical protein
VLSDGAPHEIAISVFNAHNFFATTASLLLFLDPHARTVRGGVTADTLTAAPTPSVTANIATAADGTISGPVAVTSTRQYRIAGFVDTSHGRVSTEVTGVVRFANRQQFTITAAIYHQQIAQTTTIVATSRSVGGGAPSEQLVQFDWPLSVDFLFATNPDGTAAQTTSIDQRFERAQTALGGSGLFDASIVSSHVAPSDTRNFDINGVFTGSTGQVSAQQFFSADAHGNCFSRDITAAAGRVTAVVDGHECGR